MNDEVKEINMSEAQSSSFIVPTSSLVPVPLPQIDINVRPATMDDLSFIDGLQKKHTKMVGFMPTKQFEGKIAAGHVLIAEEMRSADFADCADAELKSVESAQSADHRLGYLIGNDQYFKHDDIGIIYQMNVVPGRQRGLIGATLLKAQFERSAYGCKLYCCWCAQDLEANHFWEAMGFVPLAFRAGSEKKSRTHIFWEKRIRSGDTTTPWWFPSQTSGGSIRQDRLVLPIPPGVRWSDEMPRILPTTRLSSSKSAHSLLPTDKQLPGPRRPPTSYPQPTATRALGGWSFSAPAPVKVAKPAKQPRQKVKNDPKFVAAARELRDRYLETVNSDPSQIVNERGGRYDVTRRIEVNRPRLPHSWDAHGSLACDLS